MERRNNQRQARPAPGPTYNQLKNTLDHANKEIDGMKKEICSLENFKRQALEERDKYYYGALKDKGAMFRLEHKLQIKETELDDECTKSHETIAKLEAELSHLKKSLHVQEEKTDAALLLSKQEEDMMVAEEQTKTSNQGDQVSKTEVESQLQRLQQKEKHMEEQILQRDTKILEMTDEKELAEKFQKELAEKEHSWEIKFRQMEAERRELEEKFIDDLAEREQSWATQHTEYQMKVSQMEEQIQLKDNVILCTKMLLTETQDKLSSKRDEALQREEAWQEKYDALEEKFTKDLAEKQQGWERQVAEYRKKVIEVEELIHCREPEILELGKQNERLHQKLDETTAKLSNTEADLVHSDAAWKAKITALEDRFTKDLAEKQQGWDAKDKQMEEETTELEDLCLSMKKKRRCFLFRRRMEDRETELEKMKTEMRKKQMEKKAKEAKAKTESSLSRLFDLFVKFVSFLTHFLSSNRQ